MLLGEGCGCECRASSRPCYSSDLNVGVPVDRRVHLARDEQHELIRRGGPHPRRRGDADVVDLACPILAIDDYRTVIARMEDDDAAVADNIVTSLLTADDDYSTDRGSVVGNRRIAAVTVA